MWWFKSFKLIITKELGETSILQSLYFSHFFQYSEIISNWQIFKKKLSEFNSVYKFTSPCYSVVKSQTHLMLGVLNILELTLIAHNTWSGYWDPKLSNERLMHKRHSRAFTEQKDPMMLSLHGPSLSSHTGVFFFHILWLMITER